MGRPGSQSCPLASSSPPSTVALPRFSTRREATRMSALVWTHGSPCGRAVPKTCGAQNVRCPKRAVPKTCGAQNVRPLAFKKPAKTYIQPRGLPGVCKLFRTKL
eukprot:365862-Chlamydomonas_euryale.AAC.14